MTMKAEDYQWAKERAAELGMSFAGYVKWLVSLDKAEAEKNNPVGRVGETHEDENS